MASTLVPLIVGLLGGLGSALVTQLLANRREDARWRREREREQALWAREDAARSYDHRRNAYLDFIKEVLRQRKAIAAAQEDRDGSDFDPPGDYLARAYERLVQIQIFGSQEAAKLAELVIQLLYEGTTPNDAQDMLEVLYDEIRRDLSIPGRPTDGSGIGIRPPAVHRKGQPRQMWEDDLDE